MIFLTEYYIASQKKYNVSVLSEYCKNPSQSVSSPIKLPVISSIILHGNFSES